MFYLFRKLVQQIDRELLENHSKNKKLPEAFPKYPEIAKKAGVEGRVYLQFVVDEQGNVHDPIVTRGIGAGCDEEAIRAIREAKFKPGKQRGKAVKVKMSLPITFKLK